jgi:hypothetical protein
VTAGWLAGCLVQVRAVLSSFHSGQARVGQTGSLDRSLAFYAHEVVLPAPGWHLAWWLQSFAGKTAPRRSWPSSWSPLSVRSSSPAQQPAIRGDRAADRLRFLPVRHDRERACHQPSRVDVRPGTRVPVLGAAHLHNPSRRHCGHRLLRATAGRLPPPSGQGEPVTRECCRRAGRSPRRQLGGRLQGCGLPQLREPELGAGSGQVAVRLRALRVGSDLREIPYDPSDSPLRPHTKEEIPL